MSLRSCLSYLIVSYSVPSVLSFASYLPIRSSCLSYLYHLPIRYCPVFRIVSSANQIVLPFVSFIICQSDIVLSFVSYHLPIRYCPVFRICIILPIRDCPVFRIVSFCQSDIVLSFCILYLPIRLLVCGTRYTATVSRTCVDCVPILTRTPPHNSSRTWRQEHSLLSPSFFFSRSLSLSRLCGQAEWREYLTE